MSPLLILLKGITQTVNLDPGGNFPLTVESPLYVEEFLEFYLGSIPLHQPMLRKISYGDFNWGAGWANEGRSLDINHDSYMSLPSSANVSSDSFRADERCV